LLHLTARAFLGVKARTSWRGFLVQPSLNGGCNEIALTCPDTHSLWPFLSLAYEGYVGLHPCGPIPPLELHPCFTPQSSSLLTVSIHGLLQVGRFRPSICIPATSRSLLPCDCFTHQPASMQTDSTPRFASRLHLAAFFPAGCFHPRPASLVADFPGATRWDAPSILSFVVQVGSPH
jgi:hypothetical protein